MPNEREPQEDGGTCRACLAGPPASRDLCNNEWKAMFTV